MTHTNEQGILEIGFVGLGLIGGSIAKSIRRVFPNYKILGYDSDKTALKNAKAIACRSEIIKKKLLSLYPKFKEKTFTAPSGIDENIITENPDNLWHDNKILDEIKDYASKIITQRDVMVRSAFNGEDLEGYSAAGLYDSHPQDTKDLVLYDIYQVMNSKNKPIAVKSREKHNIPDDLIKPSVIIQDRIISDYSFTTYTEAPFDKNKMLIELFINKNRWCKPDPYQITYNKLTKELKIEKEHSQHEEYLFDENYKLIHKQSISLKNINEIRNTLKNLVKNALVLEKEFGKPQDIEGGIKNGQLYLWQTRNIVKKIH